MSSVGSSDGPNRQDEVVRRQREEYKKTEAEAAKRHKKELKRLTESYSKDLEKLKAQHSEQIGELREVSNDRVDKRDYKYQQDIEKMRDMHTKALEQKYDESARREEALRDSLGGDNTRIKRTSDQRIEKLRNEFSEGLNNKDATLTATIEEVKNGQQEGIAENHRKLERAMNQKVQVVKDERDTTVEHLQKALADTRENSSEVIRDLKLKRMRANESASDTLLHTVGKERQDRVDAESNMREGFKEALETTKERLAAAQRKEKEAMQMSNHNLKSSAMARVNNRLNRLEREKIDLQEARIRDQTLLKQKQDRELGNVTQALGRNISLAEEARNEAVRTGADAHAKDIRDIRHDVDKQMVNTNRFYRGKLEENNQINRTAYENLVGAFESRVDHKQQTTDQRVKNIIENTTAEQSRILELHEDNRQSTLAQHREDMQALRNAMETDKVKAVNRLQDQIRKLELNHGEKMTQVVSKYEKQLQAMQDMLIKERKTGEVNLRRTVDDLQRAHKMELDKLELSSRDRLRQANERQTEELRTVNKRHEEKLDAVLTEVKKS